MPTPDMKPYAERLSKAMPERFVFEEYTYGTTGDATSCTSMTVGWRLTSGAAYTMDDVTHLAMCAFWFPLAIEFDIRAVWCRGRDADLLEATADAVCQEAERRAKEEGNETR